MDRTIFHFEVVARGKRVRPHIVAVRTASKRFKAAVAAEDHMEMATASEKAWNGLANVFEALRNEADQGRLDRMYLRVPTGFAATSISASERHAMIAVHRIDRNHSNISELTLRDVLNKVAHYDPSYSTYRIDGRGAHYLILSGMDQRQRVWIAEVLVSRLLANAAAAAKMIR